MIIFSQDREKAKQYNNIIRISYDNNYETSEEFWIVFIDGEDMAHYTTKERAREVLQEIIQCYTDIEILKMPNFKVERSISSYELFERFVYEMPEE